MTNKSKTSKSIAWAQKIYNAQKKDYQVIFKQEVKKSKSPQKAAKKAGELYRDRYGKTASERWRNALKQAKKTK